MQKKLLALAVASMMSAPVFAQSQVTLYGTFDGGIRNQSNVDGLGGGLLSMDSAGTYNSNRWGMKGSEDLGNGMKANFKLEGGFMTGTGVGSISGGLFGRGQTVGLSSKSWGKLDLGRNYTSIFYTTGAYDPFHYKYTGIIPIAGLDGARRNNTITYTSNPMNGLVIRANMGLGEVVDNNAAGRNTELGVSYGNGPFSMGIAYGVDRDAADTVNSKQWTIGGAYKTGPWEFMVGYDRDDNMSLAATGAETERKVTWLGGRYKMSGNNAVSLAYYNDKRDATAGDGTKKLWILGFVHNLSKRTEFYADIDNAKVDGSMRAAGSTDNSNTGISVGINHAF
ncbi:MAG: porin [Burkholderiales bacterium]|nr:porin [Burkholderiales bacterium]